VKRPNRKNAGLNKERKGGRGRKQETEVAREQTSVKRQKKAAVTGIPVNAGSKHCFP